MNADKKVAELGLTLPPAPSAVGVYRPAITIGNICYTSGHVPLTSDGKMIKGCVGRNVDEAEGYEAARQCGLTILSTMKEYLGDLSGIRRVIKIVGMVNCTPDFEGHPAVINGCSELFKEVFGEENGVGARSAVGMSSLPMGIMVEIEAIFELEPSIAEAQVTFENAKAIVKQLEAYIEKQKTAGNIE